MLLDSMSARGVLLLLHAASVLASKDVTLLTCPSSNGQTYTTTDGANFTIECSYDRPYGDLAGMPVAATSLQNCINLCEATNSCIDVAFYPPASGQQNGTCWEKSQANSGSTNNNVWSARQVSGPTILTCPRSNGTTFKSSVTGAAYVVECYADRPYNDLSTTQTPSLETCINTCESTNGCIDVSFSPPSAGSGYGTCWLKSFAGAVRNNNNIWAARKASVLSCPGSNGQTYKAADGSTYTIECGVDRPNNDLSHPTMPSLEACIAACEGNSACVDAAWYPSSGVCWLKNAAGPSGSNSNVWGARQLSKPSSTTTTTTSASCTPSPTAGTGKRGLGYNNATFTQPFSLSCGANPSRVSWSYNWGSSIYYPYTQATTGTFNSAIRYIPMLWSNASALTSIWNDNVNNAIANNRADAVLGFNEPDACQDGSSCMTVSSAVSAWKTYIQPFGGKVKLVSPAVTNSLNAGQGLSWLSDFINSCSGCQIDALALHWYGDITSPSSFQSYMNDAYNRFQKPIWVTEFGGTSGTPAQVASFLQVVLPWIDQQNYIVRAMYLMDAPNPDGTWLINSNGTVSSIGRLYDQY